MKNKYEIRGDVTAVFLKRKNALDVEILIDTDDLSLVSSVPTTWFFHSIDERFIYAIAKVQKDFVRKHILMHRLITNCPEGLYVDHMNHNTLDNRKSNLRNVTKQENNLNLKGARKDNKSSGLRGVYFDEDQNKWRAHISFNSIKYYLGGFELKQEAENVVNKAIDIINNSNADEVKEQLELLRPSQDVPRNFNKHSKVRNVYWDERYSFWYVKVQSKKKTHYIGSYKNLKDAEIAAKEARIKYMPYSQEASE